ncbi:MAG: hypothetical protein BJG00_002750 [Limnothrix sp. CACIAM 69d]|nr:MAG: hypothetical protein BJG00_002750 [Limnothrix sp. CACIAM 69d]
MKYFVPNLKLSADLPPQNQLEDKLGGLPWGLPPDQYPICSHCGKSQSLLAQLIHHPERLDLGRSGRVLLVFQCNHDPGTCPTWEGGSGANACLILDPEVLSDRLVPMPADSPPLELEARITTWIPKKDAVTKNQKPVFFDDDQYWDLPDAATDSVGFVTKLGSVPAWLQSPSEAPGEGWVFVGQLSASYQFLERPTSPIDIFWDESENTWICEGPNFGDGGIGYIFLRFGADQPEGWFFWQCG